uniref:Cytochrome P450 family 71 subfamily CR polypeptide 8 n=1 Tax=Leavenworthia alabamica TaxID=310722 RepID=A0A0M7RFZ0_LEAAL|nr:TPA_inf: cytochrome P450 family 71 subfamily CR polypeptide 8 [Leavenworthia alabamica]
MEQITFNSNPFLLSVFALFSVFIFSFIKRNIKSRKLNLPPSPPKLPFIGNLHQIGNLPHKSLYDLSLKYGPFMFVNLGTTRYLVVSSASALEEITKNHDITFSNRPAIASLDPLKGNGKDMVYHPYGDHWKQLRKVGALHLSSKNAVNRFHTMREEEISNMMETITNVSNVKGEEIDMSDMFNTVVTNIFHRSYTGSYKRDDTTTKKFLDWDLKFKNLMGYLSVEDLFSGLSWIDRFTGFTTLRKSTYSELHGFMDKLINEREKESFVDVLIRLRDEDKVDYDVKAVMEGTFVAAIESVALELEWLLSELIKNPEVLKKAQEEVQRVVGTKAKISSAEIEQMHYLRCIIKESLRLHPPGIVPRQTSSKWIKLGGYDIPPNTKVLVNLFAVQCDPKDWEKPSEFIPERFMEKNIEFMGNQGYAPFGFGRRNCPGIAYGMALLEDIFANLLYRFDWKMPDDSRPEKLSMEEVSQFVVTRKYPLKLVPILRCGDNE